MVLSYTDLKKMLLMYQKAGKIIIAIDVRFGSKEKVRVGTMLFYVCRYLVNKDFIFVKNLCSWHFYVGF